MALRLAAVDLPGLPQQDVVEGPGDLGQGGPVHVDDPERLAEAPDSRSQGGGDPRLDPGVVHLGPGDAQPQRARAARCARDSGRRAGARGADYRGEDPGGDRDVGAEHAHVVERRRERLHAGHVDGAERRLESDDAAVMSGDADRAAGIGAEGDLARADSDQSGRAAAGAPGGPPGVERVARLRHLGVYGARGVLEQGGGGEDVRARLAQRRDHRGVGCRGRRLHVVRAPVAAGVPGDVDEVLHRDRDAVQGAVRPAGRGGKHADHRVQRPSEAERSLAGGQ